MITVVDPAATQGKSLRAVSIAVRARVDQASRSPSSASSDRILWHMAYDRPGPLLRHRDFPGSVVGSTYTSPRGQSIERTSHDRAASERTIARSFAFGMSEEASTFPRSVRPFITESSGGERKTLITSM